MILTTAGEYEILLNSRTQLIPYKKIYSILLKFFYYKRNEEKEEEMVTSHILNYSKRIEKLCQYYINIQNFQESFYFLGNFPHYLG